MQNGSASTRLAVYGTLAPGRSNHFRLARLRGTWRTGTTRGWLHPLGWGATHGFPGLVPDPAGSEIAVHIFESDDLPGFWAELDAFEGEEYRRVVVTVAVDGAMLPACLYAVAHPPGQMKPAEA